MGEGHLEKLERRIQLRNSGLILVFGLVPIISWWALSTYADLGNLAILGVILGLWAIISSILGYKLARHNLKPLAYLYQAILHISPSEHLVTAPNIEDLKVGKELVTSLTRQIYELTSSMQHINGPATDKKSIDVSSQIPIPIIGVDDKQTIVFANQAAQAYCQPDKPLVGSNLGSAIDLEFLSEDTLESWTKNQATSAVSSTHTWERVRLSSPNGEAKYIDLAAQFSKHNPSGVETLLVLFDHTKSYQVDDDSLSFIALAVHELRTPLTALRGYIEVFQDELGPNLSAEHADFMRKMEASAESLASFVSNILNVARVDQNQLTLRLIKTDWQPCINQAINNMRLRAQVRGLELQINIAEGLPQVAADPITVVEVINNLLENAIKYSKPDSKKIIITSKLSKDGLVETTVQDFGLGIPASVTGELFKRFSRNFRTRSSVSGTGLGLFLSKAIISAHGGNIWVSSTEGAGSTFGFTLQPYNKVANQVGNEDNKDITRTANGWIKNHSMYRR